MSTASNKVGTLETVNKQRTQYVQLTNAAGTSEGAFLNVAGASFTLPTSAISGELVVQGVPVLTTTADATPASSTLISNANLTLNSTYLVTANVSAVDSTSTGGTGVTGGTGTGGKASFKLTAAYGVGNAASKVVSLIGSEHSIAFRGDFVNAVTAELVVTGAGPTSAIAITLTGLAGYFFNWKVEWDYEVTSTGQS